MRCFIISSGIRIFFFGCVIQLLQCSVFERNKVDNLLVFAEVYGLIKYFHPSDQAAILDWTNFSAYGAERVLNCRTDQELLDSLNSIFNYIAPSVKFSLNEIEIDTSDYRPLDVSDKRITYWQHQGLDFNVVNYSNRYNSLRVNREIQGNSLFEGSLEFGEALDVKLDDNVHCLIPMVLFCDDEMTYPDSDAASTLSMTTYENPRILSLRIGNIINFYNLIKYFYPYWDEVEVNWEVELQDALHRCFMDSTAMNHLVTIQKFSAPLNDGHVNFHSSESQIYRPPIITEIVEGKLVVVNDVEAQSELLIKRGDLITHINGQEFYECYNEVYSRISASTEGYKHYIAGRKIMEGAYGSEVELRINNVDHSFRRSINSYKTEEANIASIRYIEDSILYIDLSQSSFKNFEKNLPRLQRTNDIILDLRGYPNDNNWKILQHFITEDTSMNWMQVPQRTRPYDIDSFNYYGFGIEPKQPHLSAKNVVLLTNGKAISQAESIIAYFKRYDVATIVGQPTAGTNGEVIQVNLLGGYSTLFTGMRVTKHDGSQLHGIGILPDVYVESAIEGVTQGIDEYIERAIKIINER